MTTSDAANRSLDVDTVAAWCRSARTPTRLPLAAAAGDPVALSALGTQLAALHPNSDVRAAVETLAVRRPERLEQVAAHWPDDTDDLGRPEVWTAWAVSLRHLDRNGRVDPDAAALDGPLREEAVRCGIVPTRSPAVRWDDFCESVHRRTVSFDELRLLGLVGFVDRRLDTGRLVGLDPTMLRPLRNRWGDAEGLDHLLAATDLDPVGPWGLAVWWEAAEAIQATDREQRMSIALLDRLTSSDDPGRWWPAVLAFLTDWRTP